MLKNSKLLKGISLVFACVLALGCCLLLGDYVKATNDTVIFYVSDNGDNTKGTDEATAFTSIDAALTEANKMKLPTGSQLKLIVVDRITVTTQAVDSVLVLDENGYRLPVTITSQEGSSTDDFSDIYLAYEDSTASSASQYATFKNDLTFKNIGITIKIQDYSVGFSTTSSTKYCQKSLYFIGNNTVFDNCLVDSEREGSDVPDIVGYVDYSTNNAIYSFDKHVTFKNGTYTGIAWFFTNFRVPGFSITIDIEDATFGSFDLLRNSSTATTQDMNKLTVNLRKGAKVTNAIWLANTGHYTIPEGVTINYYEGCEINKVGARNGSANSTAGFDASITHNIYGGTINKFYATPYGLVTGDVTVNMYGGTVKNYYGAGVGAAVNVKGAITNNIYGGTIGGTYYDSDDKKDVNGSFHGGGSDGGTYTTITNNLHEGVEVLFTYYGGHTGTGHADVITNNLDGVVLYTGCYGGSIGGTYGTIINNFHNVTQGVNGEYLRAGTSAAVGDYIINNFSGDCVFNRRVYLGNFDTGADTRISITNNISGNCQFKGEYDGGSQRGGISGDIINNISGGTFSSTYYGGNRGNAGNGTVHNITNNISAGTFNGTFYGGNNGSNVESPVKGTIKNIISGGTFATFYGGNYILACGEVEGDILNYVSDGTFTAFYAGNRNNNVYGKVLTEFTGGEVTGNYTAGTHETGNVYGGVITNLYGGTFHSKITGVNATAAYTVSSATINIAPQSSAELLKILGSVAAADDLVVNLFGSENRVVLIGSDTTIPATNFVGTQSLMLLQTGSWTENRVYVDLANPADVSLILPSNSQATEGSGVFDGRQVVGSTVTVGGVTPEPTMVSFLLKENLGVRFWIPLSQISDYMNAKHEWSYSIDFMDNTIEPETVYKSVSELPQADIQEYEGEQYFTFVAGLGIPASQYNESITVWMCSINPISYTVYDLLESGIQYAQACDDAKLETLVKAIYQYGDAADNYFDKAKLKNTYEVAVEGEYTQLPEINKIYRGFNIDQLSLSLDEKIAMNFYISTNIASDVSFRVVNTQTGAALDSSYVSSEMQTTEDGYYCYIVSAKLDASMMNSEYRLEVVYGGEVYITCTNSLARSCAYYVQNDVCTNVANAILAYMESVQKYLAN